MGRIDGWVCTNNKGEKVVFPGDILRTHAEAKLLRYLCVGDDGYAPEKASAKRFQDEGWEITPVTFVTVGGCTL